MHSFTEQHVLSIAICITNKFSQILETNFACMSNNESRPLQIKSGMYPQSETKIRTQMQKQMLVSTRIKYKRQKRTLPHSTRQLPYNVNLIYIHMISVWFG